jgi:hypothetical protein
VVLGGSQLPFTHTQSGAGLIVVHPPGGGGGGVVVPPPPPEYDPDGPPPDANEVTSVLPIPLKSRALNVVSHVLETVLDVARS